MAQSTLEVIISARDKASGSINKVSGSLKGLSASVKQVGRGVGKVGLGLARVGALAATTFAAGIVTAAKVAGDFESQLNVINTIARESEEGLGAIGQGIRKLARETGAPLEDLTAAYYDLLSAGIKVADAQDVLTTAHKFGVGALATTNESVNLLTTALNAYNLGAGQAGTVADQFAKAVELGAVHADEIAASLANVAPIASQFGIGLDEIAAAYGYLTLQGTPAAEVTTQMARAILELNKPSADLLKLQKKLRKSYADIARDKGLQVALQELRDDAAKAKVPFQDLFGRVEALKFAYQVTGDKGKAFALTLDKVQHSAGTVNAQFSERAKGLNYQVGRLKANLIDAAISLGEGLAPALGRLADKLTAFIEANRGNLKQLGEDVGKFIDDIDFDAVVKAGQRFVDVLKLALDAVKKIPPEILAATAGFLTLNKLSGGLIAQGLGDIVGGLGSAAARGVAARTPGVGALFAQPVFVTNWPPGMGLGAGVGGKGTGAAGNLLRVTVVGAVAIAGLEAGISLAGLNDPRHRTATGQLFRGTNVPSEQLANLLDVEKNLVERAEKGDTYAQEQLVRVRKAIARLGDATASGARSTAQAVADAATYGAYQDATWGKKYLAKLDEVRKAFSGLKPLKPTRLPFGGDPRKLQSSAAITELMGLKTLDPAVTAKITRDIAVLLKTGTESPAKIRPLLADMGVLLEDAVKSGDVALQTRLVASISQLEAATGVHLAGLDRRLVQVKALLQHFKPPVLTVHNQTIITIDGRKVTHNTTRTSAFGAYIR